MRNIFEDSFTEEGAGAGEAMFEEGFNFVVFEARKNLGIIASSVHRE